MIDLHRLILEAAAPTLRAKHRAERLGDVVLAVLPLVALLFALVLLMGHQGAVLVLVGPFALVLLMGHQGATALALPRVNSALAAERPSCAAERMRSAEVEPAPSRGRAAAMAKGAAGVVAALTAPKPAAPPRPSLTGESAPKRPKPTPSPEAANATSKGAAGVVAALTAPKPAAPRRPSFTGESAPKRPQATPSAETGNATAERGAGDVAALKAPMPAPVETAGGCRNRVAGEVGLEAMVATEVRVTVALAGGTR